MADLTQRVESIVQNINTDSSIEILPETDLFAEDVLDSFGMVEYILALENEFGIKIPDEDLIPQNLWSIEATVKTVKKCLA